MVHDRNNNIFFGLGRTLVKLDIHSEETAFLSTLALLSSRWPLAPDMLEGLAASQINLICDLEAQVLRVFQGYMRKRWPTRPLFIGKLVALLADIRNLSSSVSLRIWLEPSSMCLLNNLRFST